MFCPFCGTNLEEGAPVCLKCGKEQPRAARQSTKDLGVQLRVSSRDALDVVKKLLPDPIGNLHTVFADLGPDRALGAGIALCLVFALAVGSGVMLGAQQWLGQLNFWMGGPQGLGAFVKIFIQLLLVPGALIAISYAIKRIVGAKPSLAADVFIAGVALAPVAFAVFLAGIVGAANLEIAMLLVFFALFYLVLLLYSGMTQIGGMSQRAAAPAVPTTILLAAWLCKVVFAAV